MNEDVAPPSATDNEIHLETGTGPVQVHPVHTVYTPNFEWTHDFLCDTHRGWIQEEEEEDMNLWTELVNEGPTLCGE